MPEPVVPQAPAADASGWSPPQGALVGKDRSGREFYIPRGGGPAVYRDGGKSAPTARQQAQAAPPPARSSGGFNYVNPNSPEGRLAGVQGPPKAPRYINPNSPEGRLVRDGVLDEDALRRGETRYRTDSNSAYATDPTTGGFTEGGRQAFLNEERARQLEARERMYQEMVAKDRAIRTRSTDDPNLNESMWDQYSNTDPTSISDADRAFLARQDPRYYRR